MKNDTPYSGERMSFIGLFKSGDFRIEIPKIQRDYAQGRAKEKAVRTKFLEALFVYLEEGKPNRDLDFVYGNINKDQDGKNAFIPLDGQQRLTTLFLLHWYLAHISKSISHLQGFLQDNDNSRFTYETRSSSREFCNALLTEKFEISWNSQVSISKWIRNQGWFFTFWDNDPTVNSMLEMLDEIHGKFKGHPDFYERLVNEHNPVITFQFLNLEEFKLTDDLYIKMNSRGKPLSPFENFKAKFEGKISALFNGTGKTYTASWLKGSAVSPSEYFSFKIDTLWLGFFWKLSGLKPQKVDGYLMNFIRTILAGWYAANVPKLDGSENKTPFLQKLLGSRIKDEHSRQNDIDFYVYDKIGCITVSSVTELIASFDNLLNFGQADIKSIAKDQFDLHQILNKVAEGTLVNQERLLFFAFNQYLVHHSSDLPSLKKWIRVAFNLIENTRVEFEQLEGGFIELNKLMPNAHDILEHLCLPETEISNFYSQQIIEEKIKAHLILKGSEWEDLVNRLEQDKFNRGQIGYLLEFSGIWSFYEANSNCDWNDTQNTTFFHVLREYGSKSSAVLPYLEEDNTENLWERAVLTKGDYLIPTSANRFNLLNSTSNLRDYSWKRFLRLNPKTDKHYDILKEKRPYVKALFDDVRFDTMDPWNSLREISNDGTNDWRNYFIEESKLVRNCKEGFIRFENEKQIRILKKKQLNSYHYELYSYAFFYKYLDGKNFETIGEFTYEKGYGWDYLCFIRSEVFNIIGSRFQVRILFEPDSDYNLIFSKSDGARNEDSYADELKDLLTTLKFGFIENEYSDWTGFYYFTDDSETLFESLQSLISELKTYNNE